MRMILPAVLAIAMFTAAPVLAQQPSIALPEINIGASPPTTGEARSANASERCVDVQIGGSRAFNCLNQKLRQEVDRVNPSANIPPIDARSPDIRVGVVNMPAVQQQYGRNFGVSVIPYRPAPRVFTAPIGPRR